MANAAASWRPEYSMDKILFTPYLIEKKIFWYFAWTQPVLELGRIFKNTPH